MFAQRFMRHYPFYLIVLLYIVAITVNGCANIIPPSGGPRDSLPPILVEAVPADSARNIKPNRIVLTFNEYVELQNAFENVIVSPTTQNVPIIDSRLRTVTIRIKDTLEPNTTYSINFGNSIRDVNEGNILRDFTYVFSTGSTIDNNSLTGRVVLAETGKVDSSLIVVLHRDTSDSAIIKQRPRYFTRLNGEGVFRFNNLPEGRFAVYALPNDYSKRYDDSTKMFAFLNSPVQVSDTARPVTLYAYEEVKRRATTPTTPSSGRTTDRRLRYTNPEGTSKDLLTPLHLEFSKPFVKFDSSLVVLTDTGFTSISGITVARDTSSRRMTITHNWVPGQQYKLILPKDAFADAEGNTLAKTDTLSFTAKKVEDYGRLKIRFNYIDFSKNPVLQIVQGDRIIESVSLNHRDWERELFKPGEYDIRILYDSNKNGVWDPGNFDEKRQPEIVQAIPKKISVRSNWDNEIDISL